MNAIVIFFFYKKNLHSWENINLMTGKGFIYSDKEELKESAAKILYLSHKQLHLRPSTLVKHTILYILYVKDLAIECEE